MQRIKEIKQRKDLKGKFEFESQEQETSKVDESNLEELSESMCESDTIIDKFAKCVFSR